MQVQPYGANDDMEQLVALFGQHQLAIQAADDVVAKESEKTAAVYQEAVNAQTAENKALQNENAVLRERLAVMEARMREAEALQETETKAKDARHAEEVAALKEDKGRLQRVHDALERVLLEEIEGLRRGSNPQLCLDEFARETSQTLHSIKVKQLERAKQGVFVEAKTMYPSNWTPF